MRSCRAEPHRKPIRRFHRPLGFCLCSSSAGGSPLSLSSSLRCCYYYDHQLCSYCRCCCCCCCCFCLNHDWMCRDYAHDKHHATDAHRKHARHTAMPARAEREVSPSACASARPSAPQSSAVPAHTPTQPTQYNVAGRGAIARSLPGRVAVSSHFRSEYYFIHLFLRRRRRLAAGIALALFLSLPSVSAAPMINNSQRMQRQL